MAIVTQPTTPTPQGDRPPRRSRRGPLLALLSSLVAAALIVAAIVVMQSRSDETGTVVAKGSTGTTLATPQTEEQKVVAVYKGFVQAENAALEVADPGLPLLGVYATGAQLQATVDAIVKVRNDGLIARAPANSVADQRVTVLSIEGDRARIRVCSIDDGFLVRAATGVPLAPSRVSTALKSGEMLREGGVWKLSFLNRDQKWDGVAGCWVGQ